MKTLYLAAALGSVLLLSQARGGDAPPVHVLQTLQIGGEGRWDYITADAATHRIYMSRSTHTQVIDMATGHVVADWPDTAGVHGVALAEPATADAAHPPTRAFVSCGKANAVAVFDLTTNKRLADVPAGKGPDSIIYDPASDSVLACNHAGGTITFIAATPGSDGKYATQDLEIGGALEAAVADGQGHAYVDVEDKNEVVAIDTKARKVLAHYPLTGGEGPSGLAIDLAHHRLFVSCGENAKMMILDETSGKVLGTVATGARTDGCAFDPASGRAYASGGDGTLTIVTSEGDKFSATTLKTEPGARTISIDTGTGRVYLPTAEMKGEGRQAKMTPDTFHILVVGEK